MNSNEQKRSSDKSGEQNKREQQSQRFPGGFEHDPKDSQHQQTAQQLQLERNKQREQEQEQEQEQRKRTHDKAAADGQRERSRDGSDSKSQRGNKPYQR